MTEEAGVLPTPVSVIRCTSVANTFYKRGKTSRAPYVRCFFFIQRHCVNPEIFIVMLEPVEQVDDKNTVGHSADCKTVDIVSAFPNFARVLRRQWESHLFSRTRILLFLSSRSSCSFFFLNVYASLLSSGVTRSAGVSTGPFDARAGDESLAISSL